MGIYFIGYIILFAFYNFCFIQWKYDIKNERMWSKYYHTTGTIFSAYNIGFIVYLIYGITIEALIIIPLV